MLVDLGSHNGTFLVGQKSRITRHTLRDGNEITLGRTRLSVSLSKPAGTTEATATEPSPTPPAAEPRRPRPAGVGAQHPSDLPIVLTVLSGPDRGMVFAPTRDVITIGRLSGSDVPLNDAAVSRRHATIKRESGGYWIYDEASRNGTELGSPAARVFHAELHDDDVVRVGETEIRVDIGAGKSTAPTTTQRTTLVGAVGDRTFTMTIRGLAAPPQPRTAAGSDVETRAIRRTELGLGAPAAPAPTGATRRLRLRVVSGPDSGKVLEAPGAPRFTVGRGETADLRLDDPGVSSVHFSVAVDGNAFVLKDEGSRNGTWIRGQRVTTATLRGGERIRAGGTELEAAIEGAAAAEGTLVMPPPLEAAPAATAAPQPAAAAEKKPVPAALSRKREEVVPELARSAEAKERISRIMKGVSLRPMRRPGTPRQWASLALVLLAVVTALAFPRTWVSAGPVHRSHADIEAACQTCHTSGPALALLSIAGPGTSRLRMDASCATADCHADDLLHRADVRDNCIGCHTEHRGRAFDIRGGEDLCWSCHVGRESPQDFGTRLMQVAVTRDEGVRARLAARVRPVEVGLKFSHEAHDRETRGDEPYDTCVGCHPSVEKGRTFALPGHAQCLDCHEKAVAADHDLAKQQAGPGCVECHTREDGEMAELPPRGYGFVIFSHEDHLSPNAECKSCHAEIWTEGPYRSVTRQSDLYPVAMDACYTCHQQKQATVACLDCHREHHSFASPDAAAAAGTGRGFDGFLLVLLTLSVGAIAYTWVDVRVARRWLEMPAVLPPAVAPSAQAPAGAEPAGEILPFPKVDVEACISCSSCYNSCPKQVLAGDDHGKSTVVNPDACIAREGCAVCEQGCPTGAIRVSTAPLKRTVERPEIDAHNEAKIPGLFFAGEVIGAALIKSAINQGTDCVKYIAEKKPKVADASYDVVIVGAGPAGLGAALAAKNRGLRYLVLERDTVASTIKNYPRDKAVLAEPVKMPLYGMLPMMDADKDTLMAVWTTIVKTTGLDVNEYEEVTDVRKKNGFLEVTTSKGSYAATNVVLAIGTRGNPRRLGVPGEEPARVAYNLIDAADWKGKKVLVVGGGDSAIEAAVALAAEVGTTAVLSYRKDAFSRVKPRNVEKIDEAAKAGRLEVIFNSQVREVRAASVVLGTEAGDREIPCDQVFALIGADPPKGWIEKLGVAFVIQEEEVVTWS